MTPLETTEFPQNSATASFPAADSVAPVRLYLVTIALVILTELGIMLCIESFLQLSPRQEAALDAALLALVIIPLLFMTLYRPLHRYIREVKRAGEALQYSEHKYSTVVENSPAGVFIYRDNRFVFANPKLLEIFQKRAEELLHVDPLELVATEYREPLKTLLGGSPKGEDWAGEVELQILAAGTGLSRWVSARATKIHYRGADSILGLLQDVTPRKVLEQELRRVSTRRLSMLEEERAHLARELHDGIGQSLSGIKFLIEHTIGQIYPDERRKQMEELRALIPRIQDTVEEVRRISMNLRPSTLDDLGLLSTITWLLRQVMDMCPHIQVEHDLTIRESDLPEPLKIIMYRTLQEALNNAVKHCGECTVQVRLAQRDGLLCLTVADDGHGFDPEEIRARDLTTRGYGLGSMRERVELSGGSFELQTAPGKGVTIHAVWPATERNTEIKS